MLLYHGTNIRFEKPKILTPNRALDFGIGFYTTSNRKQASDWANDFALNCINLVEVVEL
jgi:allantoicase